MLARLRLQRLADALSSRYVVVEREVTWRSPIIDTPYVEGQIHFRSLVDTIFDWYRAAGIADRAAVDTGAVILTGAAAEKRNAREVDAFFAQQGGRFVCATAGHHLEAILSAHGSGAVARSRLYSRVLLAIDLGGGTTKLALVDRGEIVSVTAIRAGARHVALPVERMADAIADASRGRGTGLELLAPLATSPLPDEVLFCGGVSEHYYGRDRTPHGDEGLALADALRTRDFPAPVIEAAEGIRATVVGASQFSVQLSGATIFVSDPAALPLRGVPVVRARVDQIAAAVAERDEKDGALAIAVPWRGDPRHDAVRALAERIRDAAAAFRPLVVALDADVGHTLGRLLRDELGVTGPLVVIDGLELRDLDYIDIGAVVKPAGVVPVVIKSLVFPS
jgi:ethanolamine utilization protein EutA